MKMKDREVRGGDCLGKQEEPNGVGPQGTRREEKRIIKGQ